MDTYKNSGTRPAQFGSFWRGNKKYPKKALKMVLYNTQHEITQEHLALVSEPVPNIVLDKNAISTVAGTSYITVKLPGHGFRKDDSMYLSNIVGRKETMISIPTSGAASITVGDKVYKNGSTPNADGSYNGPWGYVINKGSASPVLLTVAMVSGIFVAAELLNGSAGGSGTINSVGGDLTGYDVRYFGGVKVNHADADSLEKVEWKVDSNGLTADEFRLTTSGISDLEFHRTSIINDSGSVTLSSTPPRNASQIYYSGRMISNGTPNVDDIRQFKHRNSSADYDATLNEDTILDHILNVDNTLQFKWFDNRTDADAIKDNVPFIDRKTVSSTIIKNLSSSNYLTRKGILKKSANSVKVSLDAFIPYKASLKVYIRVSTAISEGKFEDSPWIEVRPDTKIFTDDTGFNTYSFTNDDLADYGIYQVKLVMSTTDTTKVAKVKNLKVIPNKIDNSLKPLQVATVQINKFISKDTIFNNRDEITIPCDFVVENAVCIIESAQDNNAAVASGGTAATEPTTWDRAWAVSGDIKKYADGSIFPAYSHKQTGCVVRFWKKAEGNGTDQDVGTFIDGADADGFNVKATILMFGRK